MAGYTPTIYLRNVFSMKWDKDNTYLNMFIEGKRKFIDYTRGRGWSLIAAFAEWPVLREKNAVEIGFDMIQIWRLDNWPTLYQTMVELSETRWYRDLGKSLASENQELLINAAAFEPGPDIKWLSDDQPGYTYLYEVSRPCDGRNHAYLRELNWLSAEMSRRAGWKLVWWASQVTAQPAQLSVLWRVPDPPVATSKGIPQDLADVAQERERYNQRLMPLLQTSTRRIYYPIYTERLAQLAAGSTTRKVTTS